jgi:hypothetical protein
MTDWFGVAKDIVGEGNTLWGIAVKGDRDPETNQLRVKWFKTRNERYQESKRLKAAGLDWHTFEKGA